MSVSIVGFAGSSNRPSRTKAVVARAAGRAAHLAGGTAEVFDLHDLGPSFGRAASANDLDPAGAAVLQRILDADALVIGTPVHKGSFAGLFKHLFDLVAPDALAGKPVLLTATGGGYRHALVIEHQLRPLFGFFEAATVPTGIYAASEDLIDGTTLSPAVEARLVKGVDQLVAQLSIQTAAQKPLIAAQ